MIIFKKLLSACILLSMSISVIGCTNFESKNSLENDSSTSITTEVSETETSSEATTSVTTKPITTSTTKIETTVTTTTATSTTTQTTTTAKVVDFSLSDVGTFNGQPYIAVNGNKPYFVDADITNKSYESYSTLDSLGRCGVAIACIGQDIMPTEERGAIGMIKPSGWHLTKYDNIDGKYLYNRCHLIGYQLSGENANEKNLITETRYLNTIGMLPFENMVADYVRETNNHVLYRVKPIFDGNNLLASGVLMEGYSVEDNGDGICFNVFCYNAQPDISINYANGDSECLVSTTEPITQAPVIVPDVTENDTPQNVEPVGMDYVVNTNTHKFHYPSCSSVNQMAEHNKMNYNGSRDELIAQGYEPCKRCNP